MKVAQSPHAKIDGLFLASRFRCTTMWLARLNSSPLLSSVVDSCTQARVAAFLLDLAQKFTVRGYSPRAFVLPMSRRDMRRT
jgi:hypothetical protein